MLVSRDATRAFGLILLLALSMVGCQSAPEQIVSKVETDDFGGVLPNKEEITVESVQKAEMMHRRAQAELRLGPSFPFDLFDPGRDPLTKIGIAGGGKLQLETAKDIYMGLSVDWTDNLVEDGPAPAGAEEQIKGVDGYDRLSVLGTIDYDIPINPAVEGLVLRMGMGIGMTVIDFNTGDNFGGQKVEDIYQIMFRPSIGLRLPVSENLLVFSELTYDIVPERTMATESDQALFGERAIFSSGALIFGVSLQW